MSLYPSTSLIYHDNIIIYSNPLSDSQWIQIHWRHFIQCSCQNASGNLTPNLAYPITLLMTLYSHKSLVRQFLMYLFNSAKADVCKAQSWGETTKRGWPCLSGPSQAAAEAGERSPRWWQYSKVRAPERQREQHLGFLEMHSFRLTESEGWGRVRRGLGICLWTNAKVSLMLIQVRNSAFHKNISQSENCNNVNGAPLKNWAM